MLCAHDLDDWTTTMRPCGMLVVMILMIPLWPGQHRPRLNRDHVNFRNLWTVYTSMIVQSIA